LRDGGRHTPTSHFERAEELDPDDDITSTLRELIENVRVGKIAIPTKIDM
jgi:hypothetical protein